MKNGNGAQEKMEELDRIISELAGLRRQMSECLEEEESSRNGEDLEALRRNEGMLRDWFDRLPQSIFVKDKNLAYQWCNQVYARDLHAKPEEIVGKNDRDFYPSELASKYEAEEMRILATGEKQETEDRFVLFGQDRTVFSTKIPLKDEQGNPAGILGTFWDISERKKAEEEPKKYIERMKKLVFERGAQIESLNDHLQKEIAERKRVEEELQKLRASTDGGRPKNLSGEAVNQSVP